MGPADLGEMAADTEMQKAFYQKKRPYDAILPKPVSDLHNIYLKTFRHEYPYFSPGAFN